MNVRMMLLALGSLCAAAGAQTAADGAAAGERAETGDGAAAAPQPAERWVGVVRGTKVHVRSGPSTAYYRCCQVSEPQQVTVVGRRGNWLRIEPVPGCWSVISTKYVKPAESGRTGTVTGDRVLVRAGGTLAKVFRERHSGVYKNRGDKVTILGSVRDSNGTWYRIVPPEGACWWIESSYVARPDAAGDGEGVTVAVETPDDGEGPAEPPAIPESPRADGEAVRPDMTQPMDDEARKAMEAFQAAENAWRAEAKKPASEQDLAALLTRYQALELPADSPLAAALQSRIDALQAAIRHRERIRQAREAVEEALREQRERQLRETLQEAEATYTPPPPQYTATGVLTASAVFTGGPRAPKRFLLRQPGTGRITAYAQCTSGVVDLSAYAGKHVGVFGQKHFDIDLATEVVEISGVLVLDEPAELPRPPQPKVGQMPPPPAPKVPPPAPAPVAPTPTRPSRPPRR